MDKKRPYTIIGGGLAILASVLVGMGLGSQQQTPPEPAISVEVGQYTQQAEPTEYAVLLYMVGSDLESEAGAATADLQELLAADLPEQVRVVGEAGGSTKWHTDGFEAENNTRFLIEDGELSITQSIESRNMGNASTLADFLCYARTSYPAENFILILWDHGDGPVGGFGCDMIYGGDSLSLIELDAALKGAECDKQPLDVIGLDACCMATLETALTLSPYAEYMVASQEMEPADGWDYTSVAQLPDCESSEAMAEMLAKHYYEKNIVSYSDTTVSTIDLSKVEPLGQWVEQLAKALKGQDLSQLMPARGTVVGYGGAGRAAGQSDLVDLSAFANAMLPFASDMQESQGLKELMDQAVVLSCSQDDKACGLSLYAPYAELDDAADQLTTYCMLQCLPEYEKLAEDMADYLMRAKLNEFPLGSAQVEEDMLTASVPERTKEVYLALWEQDELQPEYYYLLGTDGDVTINGDTCTAPADNEWTYLGGEPLCTLELPSHIGLYTQFACPVLYEGNLANLIIQYDTYHPYGRVVHLIPVDSNSFSRQIITLTGGERITPLYPVEAFDQSPDEPAVEYQSVVEGFKVGNEITYSPDMELEALPAVDAAQYGFWFITCDNQNLYAMAA